jgi:hypothetical protein
LNKTLDKLFAEIRREAKRNHAFADRLEAVILAHASARNVPEALVEAARGDEGDNQSARPPVLSLNPVAHFVSHGAEDLKAQLKSAAPAQLKAMIEEHNLDPAGETKSLGPDALIAHILAQAKKRVDRDKKMFDY